MQQNQTETQTGTDQLSNTSSENIISMLPPKFDLAKCLEGNEPHFLQLFIYICNYETLFPKDFGIELLSASNEALALKETNGFAHCLRGLLHYKGICCKVFEC